MTVRDALVVPPPAVGLFARASTLEAPTPEELAQLLGARNRELETELEQLKTTAGTLANAALSLAYVSLERDGRPLTDVLKIRGEVSQQMEGARIIVGQEGDDLLVQIGTR